MIAFFDYHSDGCTCSYCGNGYDRPLRMGLNVPQEWRAHNAWFVIRYRKHKYFRFCHGLKWLRRNRTSTSTDGK